MRGQVMSVWLAFFAGYALVEAGLIPKSTGGCAILINGGLGEPQPLILWNKNGSGFAFPESTGYGYVTLASEESLRLACPGTRLELETSKDYDDTTVTCIEGSTFSVDGEDLLVQFEDITCTSYPDRTARRTGVSCPGGEICEIGFTLNNNEFHRIIDVCHDDVNHHTITAHNKILAVIDSAQTSFPRPSFIKGDFYVGVSMATIYTRVNQRATIAKIFNSEELALQYIPASGTFYLAKGHLVAKTDLIYGAHQRATFYYINTIPMWQNVNAGNWATMEANIRKYATNMNVDLDVWTGSIGTLTLPDLNGLEQELHLYVDDNNNRAVPVPKILFRVIYQKESKAGIVILIANNPYLEKLTDDYVLCKDICDQVSYLTWVPTTSTRGLAYCCEVDDFRKSFAGLEEFVTTSILL